MLEGRLKEILLYFTYYRTDYFWIFALNVIHVLFLIKALM